MARVPNGVETLPKISIAWVERTNDTDADRQRDGRRHKANVSSRSLIKRVKSELVWVHSRETECISNVFNVCQKLCLPTAGSLVARQWIGRATEQAIIVPMLVFILEFAVVVVCGVIQPVGPVAMATDVNNNVNVQLVSRAITWLVSVSVHLATVDKPVSYVSLLVPITVFISSPVISSRRHSVYGRSVQPSVRDKVHKHVRYLTNRWWDFYIKFTTPVHLWSTKMKWFWCQKVRGKGKAYSQMFWRRHSNERFAYYTLA